MFLLKLQILCCFVIALYAKLQRIVLPVRSRREIAESFLADNIHGIIEKGYYVEVLIGTPPQHLNILIDTGSSNFAVASKANPLALNYYESQNSTSVKNMNIPDIDIEYTEGFWKGQLVTDLVTIPSANMTMSARVSIVEITKSRKFFINGSGWQGILGMSYTELVRPNNPNVKSFMQKVVEDTGMDDLFSLKLCMGDVKKFSNSVSGTFILGGYDRSIHPIYWTKVVREWYYDVLVLGMNVGNLSIPVDCDMFNDDKSIVDSGTTNLRFPRKIFESTIEVMQKNLQDLEVDVKDFEAFWGGEDVLCWDKSLDPYALFPTLTIYLPSIECNNTISLYVHPQHYILFNGNDTRSEGSEKACFKFGISPSDTGTVLGAVLMEEYNVIFDRANKRVGFAASDCSSTSKLSYTQGYLNSTSCVHASNSSPTGMQIALYVLLGILLLCILPVCVLTYAWCCKRKNHSAVNDTDNLLNNPIATN